MSVQRLECFIKLIMEEELAEKNPMIQKRLTVGDWKPQRAKEK